MLDQYSMQLWSWWALFGAAVTLGLVVANDDDDPPAAPPTEPPTDPRLEPFEIYSDFEADSYENLSVGTPGDDEIIASLTAPGAINGEAGNDIIRASNFNDYVLGGFGDDSIRGEPGADIIRAGEGADDIHGGFGNDTIYGDAGNDYINGARDNDRVSGGEGDDHIIGFYGADSISGDAGNDTLSGYRSGFAAPRAGETEEADTLDGGDGDDQLWLSNGDQGTGGAGKDQFLADWRSEDTLKSVTINDYNAQEDQISLLITPPAEGEPMPEVTQQVSEDGADRLVYMNGIEIARVVGAGSGGDLNIATLTEPPASGQDDTADEEEQPPAP